MVQTLFAPAACTPQQLDAMVRLKEMAGRIKGVILHNVMFDFKTVTRSFAALECSRYVLDNDRINYQNIANACMKVLGIAKSTGVTQHFCKQHIE